MSRSEGSSGKRSHYQERNVTHHGTDSVQKKKKNNSGVDESRVPCGLINQGMTCYLNAVLQTIFMTSEYRHQVLSIKKEVAGTSPEDNVSKALAHLFSKLEKHEETPAHTREVTQALNITNVCEQQDAAEYLQMILHQTPQASEIFKGVVETTTTCLSCDHEYGARTEILSIPLSMDKGSNDVERALLDYQAVHEMNGDDQLYCVKCDSLRNMETKNRIDVWPDILILQLKRFEMASSWTEVYYRKNEYKVNILPKIEINSRNYELYVIVNHCGTYSGGHYDALIKDENKDWFHFNDHMVAKCFRTSDELISYSSKSAYLLLYRVEELAKKEEGATGRQQSHTHEDRRSEDTHSTVHKMLADSKMSYGQRGTNQTSQMKTQSGEYKDTTTAPIHCSGPESNMPINSPVSMSHSKMFKQRMKEELQYLNGALHGERQLLNDIFIKRNMREETSLCTADKIELTCSNIFEGEKIKTVLTKGDAGIGKTVSVQKFVLDWAEEKTHTDISFIFLIPFQKLNITKDKECTFIELLQQCFNNTDNFKRHVSDNIMFIFDGLNECKMNLDFQKTKKIEDVHKRASIASLLTNLIIGNLLPNSRIWITSRPAAASKIPTEYVNRVTEIQGFTDEQKEEYFKRSIRDENMANRVINHIKTSRRINSMCHIPDYCRIITTMSEEMFRTDCPEIPETLTQMYATFLVAQTKSKQGSSLKTENIIPLGEQAFQLLMDGKSLISADFLKKHGISDEYVRSSSAILKIIEDRVCSNKKPLFCFVNRRIQEFLAALYMTEIINRGQKHKHTGHVKEFFKLKLKISSGEQCFTDCRSLQNVVDEALERQMDLFLCFLLGLSLESSQRLLQDVLTQRESSSTSKQAIIQNITTMIQNCSTEKCSCLFDCLMELNEHLVQGIKTKLKFKAELSPAQWSDLMSVLLKSEEQLDENKSHQLGKSSLRLTLRTPEEPKVYQYGTGVEGCTDQRSDQGINRSQLDLRGRYLEDSEVKQLSSLLKDPQCKLQNLCLRSCNIKEEGCAVLSSVLRSQSSYVTELDLSYNDIRDSGAEQLSAVIEDPQCKLQKLWLKSCRIGERGSAFLLSALELNPSHLKVLDLSENTLYHSGVEDVSLFFKNSSCRLVKLMLRSCNIKVEGCAVLSSALRSQSSHLTELDLSYNDIRDSGVKQLSALIEDPQCKLQKLWLRSCYIYDRGCAVLSSALRSNPSHLTELDLSYNYIQDSGVKQLSALIEDPQCKLQKLWLRTCYIYDRGCADLSSALRSNPSHLTELDLSYNDIRDSGVKQLSALLEDPQCKLQKLWLRSCYIYDRGCADLSSALRSNPSHLTELDLSNNYFGYLRVNELSALKENPQCKLQKLWITHSALGMEVADFLSSALESNSSHLKELDLSYSDMKDSEIKQLSALLKDPQCKLQKLWLRFCYINETGCDDLCSALRSNSHLTELDLSENPFGDSGVKHLSALLKHPQCKLEKLWLRSCYIYARGCAALKSALQSNSSHLTELDLSYNDIRDLGVKYLLENQCKLQKLWLRCCCIGDISCSALGPTNLTELDLSENYLAYSGMKHLSVLLEDPQCKLQKLWLRSCLIHEMSCADLSSALKSKSSHLRELDLSFNDIKDSGVKHLSALLEHSELEKLWLRSCNIKEEGCAVLSSVLRSQSSHLTELDLSYNDIRDSGVEHLSALIEDPQCKLQKLWLKSCSIRYKYTHILRSHKTKMCPSVQSTSSDTDLANCLSQLRLNH